jgi:hypothetical protein
VSGVRPFREQDIDHVVRIRMAAFDPPAEGVPHGDLPGHFRQWFLTPGDASGPRSLVFEGTGGRVLGFIGILSHHLWFGGRRRTMAVGTRLMVDPAAGGLAGAHLMRSYLFGPQDLAYSDMTNEAGVRLFAGLGGASAPFHALEWSFTLRPARQWLAEGRGPARHRLFRGMARPVATVLDSRALPPGPDRPLHRRDLDPLEVPRLMERLMSGREPRPLYSEEEVVRHLSSLTLRPGSSPRSAVVVTAAGEDVGWYVYLAAPPGASRVVQMGWAPGGAYDTLCALLSDAHAQGVRRITGKVDRDLLEPLRRTGARVGFSGRWTMLRTQDPALAAAIQDGRGLLGLLDGEWPTAFF